jgi:hypothetical protein
MLKEDQMDLFFVVTIWLQPNAIPFLLLSLFSLCVSGRGFACASLIPALGKQHFIVPRGSNRLENEISFVHIFVNKSCDTQHLSVSMLPNEIFDDGH